MTAPFDQFQARNKFNDPGDLLSSAVTNIERRSRTYPIDNKILSQLFLSAQAELLVDKDTSLTLVSQKSVGVGPTSAGLYDGDTNKLTLTVDNLQVDIERTAAHEMTHGIERMMGCQTEAKIALMLTTDHTTEMPRTEPDIAQIYKVILSALPFGHSKIQEQFNAQITDAKQARTRTISYEIGGYNNEALFYGIRASGGVEEFIARYQNIQVEGITSTSRRIQDAAQKLKSTAQEIIAVSVYDIN